MCVFANIEKAAFLLGAVLMLQNMGGAEAARANFTEMFSHMSKSTRSEFECPAQCLECCDNSGLFGSSFKCILRNPADVPQEAGRECTTPKKRSLTKYGAGSVGQASQQHKTYCKYIDSEEKSKEKTCSHKYQCCCAVEKDLLGPKYFVQPPWTEDRCFDNAQDGLRQELANHNGKMEWFKMVSPDSSPADQEIVNDKSSCRLPGNTHHIWDYDDRLVQYITYEETTYKHSLPAQEGPPGTTEQRRDGCCLRVRTKSVTHRWMVEHFVRADGSVEGLDERASFSDLLKGKADRQHVEKKTYTMCAEYEKIHACSDDGGVTPNGQFLYKNAGLHGTCLGDQQSTFVGEASQKLAFPDGFRNVYDRYCPEPMHGGKWCMCDQKMGCVD